MTQKNTIIAGENLKKGDRLKFIDKEAYINTEEPELWEVLGYYSPENAVKTITANLDIITQRTQKYWKQDGVSDYTKYIIKSPKGDECIPHADLDLIFDKDQLDEFMVWIRGRECIGIETDGLVQVAIPANYITEYING